MDQTFRTPQFGAACRGRCLNRSRSQCSRARRPYHPPSAFSLVELLVVIGVIALILAFSLPAFSNLTEQARRSQASQLINAATSRAYLTAVADSNLTALRFAPAAWSLEGQAAERGDQPARQVVELYTWRTSPLSPAAGAEEVTFSESFRLVGGATTTLPEGVWAAPAEAMLTWNQNGFWGEGVVKGRIGQFWMDARYEDDEFVDADDFLIVFDPDRGVIRSRWPDPGSTSYDDERQAAQGRQSSWRMTAYVPSSSFEPDSYGFETDRALRSSAGGGDVSTDDLQVSYTDDTDPDNDQFQRFNFTGVTIYQRELLTVLGRDARSDNDLEARQNVLREFGDPYQVSRQGGTLVQAARTRRTEP